MRLHFRRFCTAHLNCLIVRVKSPEGYWFRMWADNQYWPFATLTTLIGTCIACDSGLAAPFTSWLWSQPLWLLVGCIGLALMLLGMAARREE